MRPSVRLSDLAAGRLNNFDFLRFALASAVIYSHGFLLAGLPSYDPLSTLSNGRLYAGAVAVDFFFLISGFLITASWQHNGNLLRFIQNRVLRIYPAFVVVGLISGVVVAPIGAASAMEYFTSLNLAKFLAGVLTLAQLNLPQTFALNPYPTQVNGSIWTIRIEFECYLLVACFGLFGVLKRRWLPLSLFILMGLAYTFLDALPPALQRFDSHLRFLTFFLGGMSVYLYRERIPHRGPYCLGAFVLALFGCMTRAETLLLAVFGGYCIFYMAFTPRLPLQRFAARGDFSYGMYLWAWPIEQILVRFLVPAMNAYAVVALTYALTVGVAVLSWHLVEARALRLKRARIGVILLARFTSRKSLQGRAARSCRQPEQRSANKGCKPSKWTKPPRARSALTGLHP